jgi:hypothetical protein
MDREKVISYLAMILLMGPPFIGYVFPQLTEGENRSRFRLVASIVMLVGMALFLSVF